MRTHAITGLLVISLAVPTVMAASKPPAPARRLPTPEHVSAESRHQVKARMGQHAATMQNLVRAVVLLDRPTVRVLATRIADEEIVARTSGVRETQPPLLPPKFFAEQDLLTSSARDLAAAAVDGGNDAVLAERFGAVTRTCVGCHSAYLHDQVEPQPLGPKPAAK